MRTEIKIVDLGRGPQLSTCRVTVQDLVPYLQEGCAREEVMRWIPVLSREEIQVVEEYVRANYEQVMETDRRIRERSATRKNAPEVDQILNEGRAERLALMENLR